MEVNEKLTEVKEKVLKEAQGLFWRYGVKSVTMDDIARHLGMSKKTLYQFFNDKDDLICQISEAFLKKEVFDLDTLRTSSKDSVECMIRMSKYIKSSFENISPSLIYELKKYHPKAFRIFSEHKRTFLLESVVQTLQRGVEEGVFRSELDLMVLAKWRIEQIEIGFDPEVFPSEDYKLDYVQLQFFEHFINGITTVKGHQLLNQYRNHTEEKNKIEKQKN